MRIGELLYSSEFKDKTLLELQLIIDDEITYREFQVIAGETLEEKALTVYNIINDLVE